VRAQALDKTAKSSHNRLECGERYFHATTPDAIDRLLKNDHAGKQRLEAEVVRL
jgi:hypothetical protein